MVSFPIFLNFNEKLSTAAERKKREQASETLARSERELEPAQKTVDAKYKRLPEAVVEVKREHRSSQAKAKQ